MADKQIIIDGIDVSKCKHFKAWYESRPNGFGGITIENYCYLYGDNCEKHPQCLYRSNQLQQLETQLKRKEQECEELKEWQKANQPTGICETCTAKSVEDMYKYKQALDGIEKFCKDVCDSCKEFTPNRQSDISCRFCQDTQILNIINKVKEK